ncbi:MAG: hypothetical protein KDB26_08675 [Microthrixaceae bacterium]|nr:hypothetical protein [Microthrixaceae bacterium]
MSDDPVPMGNKVIVAGKSIALRYPVDQAIRHGDYLIVRYAVTAHLGRPGTFQNLEAVRLDGTVKWTAELPTNETGDCYYEVEVDSARALVARSFKSYVCKIDWESGKILESEFVK